MIATRPVRRGGSRNTWPFPSAKSKRKRKARRPKPNKVSNCTSCPTLLTKESQKNTISRTPGKQKKRERRSERKRSTNTENCPVPPKIPACGPDKHDIPSVTKKSRKSSGHSNKKNFEQVDKKKICEAFGVEKLSELHCSGLRDDMDEASFIRLDKLLASRNYNPTVIRSIINVIAVVSCSNDRCSSFYNFCALFEYVAANYTVKQKRMEKVTKNCNGQGISIGPEILITWLIENLNDSNGGTTCATKIAAEFESDLRDVEAFTAKGRYKFRTKYAAVYHYKKHCYVEELELSVEMYLNAAQTFFDNSECTEEQAYAGDVRKRIYENDKGFGVLVNKPQEDGDQWFIATFIPKKV